MPHYQEIFIDDCGDTTEFDDIPFAIILCAVLDKTLRLRKQQPLEHASYSFKPYRLAPQKLFLAARTFVDSEAVRREQVVTYQFVRFKGLGTVAMQAPFMDDTEGLTQHTLIIDDQYLPTIKKFDDIAQAAAKLSN